MIPLPTYELPVPRYRITAILHKHLKLRYEPFGFKSPPIDQLSLENGNWINVYSDRIELLRPTSELVSRPSEVISLSDPDLISKVTRWNNVPSSLIPGNPVWAYMRP